MWVCRIQRELLLQPVSSLSSSLSECSKLQARLHGHVYSDSPRLSHLMLNHLMETDSSEGRRYAVAHTHNDYILSVISLVYFWKLACCFLLWRRMWLKHWPGVRTRAKPGMAGWPGEAALWMTPTFSGQLASLWAIWFYFQTSLCFLRRPCSARLLLCLCHPQPPRMWQNNKPK